jgi:hypothetical protein
VSLKRPEIAPGRPCQPAEFILIKFLGIQKARGASTGISPGNKNGTNDILGLESAALIKHGGGYGTRLRLCLLSLWLGAIRRRGLAGVAGVATGWGTQGAVLGVVALGAAVPHSWTAMAMAPGRERWTQGRGPGRAPRVGDQEISKISNFSRGGYLIHKN